MDFERNQAASSSTLYQQAASTSSAERALRSSSRIKAAKDKEDPASEQSSHQARDLSKGKSKEIVPESSSTRSSKRARRATLPPTPAALIINEPPKDPKGKKRALPDSGSEDETGPSTSKRVKSASHSSRARKEAMPKKSKGTSKGRASLKGKAVAGVDATQFDVDNDMMDVDAGAAAQVDEDQVMNDEEDHDDVATKVDKTDDARGDEPVHATSSPPVDPAADGRRTMDDGAFSLFDFGRLGGYMSQISGRLRGLLTNIKPSADPTTKLIALQELSELLSISTEDTLAGSFQVESFVRELVRIMGGTGGDAARDEGDGEDEDEQQDEDAALAAAISMSTGGTLPGDENLEAQLLACRCLANLMEALPGSGHILAYHGAIPVLCSKLVEISYIDLAEQTLITLEKISEEHPSAIVREGGLAALLNYLDFFSIAVQRTALQAAANCLRSISAESFPMIKDVWPIIRNCLSYSDQRLVDYACLCVIRVIDSYHRSQSEKLEALVDADLVRAVNLLLLPSAGSSIVPPNTIMLLIRALATAARASPTITVTILQADLATTVYQILTGVLPATSHDESDEQGDSETGQGLGGGIADMAVVQNLSHRPKDQIEEALSLVSELMPPLPKDGVFDHKGYSEKSLSRMIKAKAKAERAAAAQSNAVQALLQNLGPSPSSSRAQSPTGGPSGSVDEDGPVGMAGGVEGVEGVPNLPPSIIGTVKEPTVNRVELLRSNSALVNKFIRLMVPIMVDVYAASISVPSRIKSLASLLKAVCFQDSQQLRLTLKNVPVASFISSILSSKDHPNLMIGGLQLTEILLAKGGEHYRAAFRREGVLHEIETLASRPLTQKHKDKDKEKEKEQVKEPDPGGEVDLPPPPVSLGRRTHFIDPEDAYTLRGRVIRFKYLSKDEHDEGDVSLARLRRLVDVLILEEAGDELLLNALQEIASLFSTQHSLSSFELLQSGLVDALLRFASPAVTAERVRRRKLLLQALAPVKVEKPVSSTSPLAVLVKKLQESLTRMESFEVITVTPGFEESKRNAPSLLARQIRLRLVADEGADTPRGGSNIIVSIHGIATFQALNDYLRPRLSGILSSMGGSRFSSMLAAAVASGRFPPGALPSGFAPPPPDSQPAAGSSNTKPPAVSDESKPERRRSLRLSAKASASSLAEKEKSNAPEPEASSSAAGPSVAAAVAAMEAANPVSGSDSVSEGDHDEFMDPEVDAEVFDEEMEHEEGETERTVTLSIADDGSKVEAQTPDGTRVATPAPARESAAAGPSASASAAKTSYAAALKNKANDWSLEFSMDDHPLPLDMTIYGAVHQHEARKAGGPTTPSSAIWSGVYTVKYKKVNAPKSPEGRQDVVEAPSRARSPIPALSSLADDAAHSKLLKLLRVLHTLNAQIEYEGIANAQILPETAFINNKLTAKLTRQLEEPLIVASSCLPDWAMDLPLHFPFLFPYSTRFSFLQSTSFGYARLILKWQSHHNRSQEGSRRDETFGFLGRLQRQKVRISRKHILESAFKVFELYGSSSSILEVEYFDEVGTGLGPTLEFYSLVSREFARRDLKIWRDADAMLPGPYVHHPQGLFPAPSSDESEDASKRINVFKIVGQFIAKAMLDSRIIDMSFNRIFLKHVLSENVPLTISNLRHVDPVLASSLLSVQNIASSGRSGHKDGPELTSVEDLMLDFTLPGYDIELRPGGKDIPVTSENVHEYIHEVLDATMGRGIEKQAKAFREGFSKVFPVNDLQAFSADELAMLFGSGEEDWSSETLFECIKADHGFSIENQSFRDLIGILSEFDKPSRRSFLQFCTGSPKLPIGGFRGLVPPLTVVRKHHEAPLTADDYLPSVMTCLNYLKVPQYSAKTVLLERLGTAMKEGVGSFHLS